MVKHRFTFGSQVHFHFSLIADGLQRIRLGIHLLHNPASQQKDISFFVQHQRCPTGIEFVQTLRIFFTEIHFPKVISTFERGEIVKIFPVFWKYGTTQVGRIGSQTYDTVFNAVQLDKYLFLICLIISRLILITVFAAIYFALFLVGLAFISLSLVSISFICFFRLRLLSVFRLLIVFLLCLLLFLFKFLE